MEKLNKEKEDFKKDRLPKWKEATQKREIS